MKLITAILSLLIGIYSSAQSDFEKAVAMSNSREYDQAATIFLKLAEQTPENTSAYFNAGNCYRHLNQNGMAIWAYFKVLKLNPSDQEASKNSDACRKFLGLTDTPFQIATPFERALISFGLSTWTYLSVFMSFAAGICLFFLLRKNDFSRHPMLRVVGFTSFILLSFSIFSTYSTQAYLQQKSYGLVVEKSAPVFVNDLGERSTLILPEGTMVKYEGLTKTKTSVTLQNGKSVFLRDSDIRWI
jgi:tetratricopeptide (TPR) repeat protein